MTNELTRERVEKLRAALEGTPDQQGFHAAAWLLRAICDSWLTHEPSDGPHRAFLEMPEGYSGPVKISNPGAPVAEVTVYPSQGASRDASSEKSDMTRGPCVVCGTTDDHHGFGCPVG